MKKSYEIFAGMSPALGSEVFVHLQKTDKASYKAAIDALAKQRKLRPVYLERKPPAERHLWMHQAVGRKSNDHIAANLLQTWLGGAHQQLLCDYLDGLEVKHDGKGMVEALPESPPKEKLEQVITGLVEKYPAELVAVYLHTFQALDDEGGWAPLQELLETDPRLALGSASANPPAGGHGG